MLTRLAATRTRVRAASSLVRAATCRTALALGAASTGVALAPTVSVRAFSVASSLAAGTGAGAAAAEESRVVHIRSESQFSKLVDEKPSVIGYYTASWCGPCRMISPVFEKLAAKHSDKIVFAKIDVDVNEDLASRYNIRAVPTFHIFVNGEKVNEVMGSNTKALEAVIEELSAD